MKNKDRMTQ